MKITFRVVVCHSCTWRVSVCCRHEEKYLLITEVVLTITYCHKMLAADHLEDKTAQ